jgi:hypothetical protein
MKTVLDLAASLIIFKFKLQSCVSKLVFEHNKHGLMLPALQPFILCRAISDDHDAFLQILKSETHQ